MTVDGAGVAAEDLDETLESSSPMAATPQRPDAIARFVVLDRLGAGGMGVVYAAWDPKLDRRVALKLVRRNQRHAMASERMIREAQAMARLNHPNVVSVFEVGTHEGAVWIAMEFVEGPTLQEWKTRAKRSWEEVLSLYREAGAGLAAAHAAGLVHRDFKPDNVLIGAEGRARVADFGLVRPVDLDEEPAVLDDSDAEGDTRESIGAGVGEPATGDALERLDDETLAASGSAGRISSAKLTLDGALLGTPRYMSPEQFGRQPVDARTDQFSFCVALYRDLYGHAPFAGERMFELAAAVMLGDPRPPPRDSGVPASVGRAIMRGLSRKPADRFVDMESLLEALRIEPRQRRWLWALGAGALGVGSAALALWLGAAPVAEPELCAEGRDQAAAIWGPGRYAQLEQHFASLAIGYGPSTLAALDESLGAWTRQWARTYADTCERRHEQSAELYDLRMACLASHREQVEGLVDLFAEADQDLVREAPALVEELPDFEACSRVSELRGVELPAADDREAVGRVRGQLARVRASIEAGRVAGVQAELARLRTEGQALAYGPLLVEIDLAESGFMALEQDGERARDLLLRAHQRALALGYERGAHDSALGLLRLDFVEASEAGLDLAARWHAIAAGLERALGSDIHDQIERHATYGRVLSRELHFREAQAEHRRALELVEQAGGHDTLEAAGVHLAAAIAFSDDSKWSEASHHLGRALAIYEARLDPHHPLLLSPLRGRIRQRLNANDFDGALADAERMVAITEAAYGEAHPQTLDAHSRVALVDDLRGDYAQAVARLRRILELADEQQTLRSRRTVQLTNSLCFGLYKLGRYDEARAACELALDGLERVLHPKHPVAAIIHNNFALIARAEGDIDAGFAHDREALEICKASVGAEHPYMAYALVGLGEGHLAKGEFGKAARVLEHALEVRRATAEPGEIGEAECLLGRALAPREPERARELGHAGLERLRAAGPNWSSQVEACAAWLAGKKPS